jgi:hypothetical protein
MHIVFPLQGSKFTVSRNEAAGISSLANLAFC